MAERLTAETPAFVTCSDLDLRRTGAIFPSSFTTPTEAQLDEDVDNAVEEATVSTGRRHTTIYGLDQHHAITHVADAHETPDLNPAHEAYNRSFLQQDEGTPQSDARKKRKKSKTPAEDRDAPQSSSKRPTRQQENVQDPNIDPRLLNLPHPSSLRSDGDSDPSSSHEVIVEQPNATHHSILPPQQELPHVGAASLPPPPLRLATAQIAPAPTSVQAWADYVYQPPNTVVPRPSQLPATTARVPQRPPSTTDTTLTCSTCQRPYANLGDYNHHQRNHVKPKICEVCGKGFADTKDLRRHRLTHDDTRTFTCPVRGCGKPYKRADYVKRHMDKNHPGVRR